MLGRIGLAIARSDPKTVYAVVENANSRTLSAEERRKKLAEGFGDGSIGDELYRSDDAGATWRKVAPPEPAAGGDRGAAGAGQDAPQGGGRGRGGWSGGNPPYYYAQIRVDPKNKEHVYLLSVGVTHTTDGGKTWSSAFNFGGDNHALWIDPNESDHMLLGFDHGMGVTFDGGRNWLRPDNMPLAQFYAIGYDMEQPYNVYGGIQDNGSARGPSTMKNGGPIPFEAWYRVGGGDGLYNVVDPTDSRWLYNESQFGSIQRLDQQTGSPLDRLQPSEGPGGAPLELVVADPDLTAEPGGHLPRRQRPSSLREPRRHLDRDQSGPDEEPARTPGRLRQHPVRDDHDD